MNLGELAYLSVAAVVGICCLPVLFDCLADVFAPWARYQEREWSRGAALLWAVIIVLACILWPVALLIAFLEWRSTKC